MAKQPLKKKEVPSFSVKDFKKNFLGEKVGNKFVLFIFSDKIKYVDLCYFVK